MCTKSTHYNFNNNFWISGSKVFKSFSWTKSPEMTTKSRLRSKISQTIFHCVLSAWGHSILRGWAQWGQNLYKAELIFSKSSNFMRYVQLLFCSEIQCKPLKSAQWCVFNNSSLLVIKICQISTHSSKLIWKLA